MGVNGRASCSLMIGVKVVCVLHIDIFEIPEWRMRGATAKDRA